MQYLRVFIELRSLLRFLLNGAGHGAKGFALIINDLKLDGIFRFFLQPVIEDGALRRIFSDRRAATIPVAEPRSDGRAGGKQMRRLACNRGCKLTKRADVIEYPKRPPVCGYDQ